jgi:hypothetical protein
MKLQGELLRIGAQPRVGYVSPELNCQRVAAGAPRALDGAALVAGRGQAMSAASKRADAAVSDFSSLLLRGVPAPFFVVATSASQ